MDSSSPGSNDMDLTTCRTAKATPRRAATRSIRYPSNACRGGGDAAHVVAFAHHERRAHVVEGRRSATPVAARRVLEAHVQRLHRARTRRGGCGAGSTPSRPDGGRSGPRLEVAKVRVLTATSSTCSRSNWSTSARYCGDALVVRRVLGVGARRRGTTARASPSAGRGSCRCHAAQRRPTLRRAASAARADSARAGRGCGPSHRCQNQNDAAGERPTDEAVDHPVLGEVHERREHDDREQPARAPSPTSA